MDNGFYVQGAFYPVPRKLELYAATSQIFGDKNFVFSGELTNNLAAAVAMLPILFEVAAGMRLDPLLFCVPAIIAASCGFMLPVATPPNAIVFGTGRLGLGQMIRAGFWLDLLAIILIPLFTFLAGSAILGIKM